MNTIQIRINQHGLTVSWGMFASVGAVHVYAQEHDYAEYEILQGGKVVFTSGRSDGR